MPRQSLSNTLTLLPAHNGPEKLNTQITPGLKALKVFKNTDQYIKLHHI